MIQINLVPDIKQEFLKAQRSKRIIVSMSVLISAGFLALVIVMWSYVNVVQGGHTDNLRDDIDRLLVEYQTIEDGSRIITVNNQLLALPELHNQKPDITRFPDFLTKLIPVNVQIRTLSVDFEASEISFSGSAEKVVDVNILVDTLKSAIYSLDDQEALPAFSSVVLGKIGISTEGESTYNVSMQFDPIIFDKTKTVQFIVPNISSDDAEFQRPVDLFKPVKEVEEGDSQ